MYVKRLSWFALTENFLDKTNVSNKVPRSEILPLKGKCLFLCIEIKFWNVALDVSGYHISDSIFICAPIVAKLVEFPQVNCYGQMTK